jgi:hypothetical protein
MNPFEKLFAKNSTNESMTSTEKVEVKDSNDFGIAITEGRLAEAESYLMAEKENPSQTGHDDHWLVNKLVILLGQYVNKKDAAGVERINQLLPENYRRQITENN